jgi:hypothetical protein
MQGSILGPLLFLFYINDDITSATKNANADLYADDSTMYVHFEFDHDMIVVESILQQYLDAIDRWCN